MNNSSTARHKTSPCLVSRTKVLPPVFASQSEVPPTVLGFSRSAGTAEERESESGPTTKHPLPPGQVDGKSFGVRLNF